MSGPHDTLKLVGVVTVCTFHCVTHYYSGVGLSLSTN